MENRIIIGIGDGAEQSHYTRKPFWMVKLKKKGKKYTVFDRVCERCAKEKVVSKQRFCTKCVKIRGREQRRVYARKMRKSRRTKLTGTAI